MPSKSQYGHLKDESKETKQQQVKTPLSQEKKFLNLSDMLKITYRARCKLGTQSMYGIGYVREKKKKMQACSRSTQTKINQKFCLGKDKKRWSEHKSGA